MATLHAVEPASSPGDAEVPYDRWRLAAGIVGRTWLWFLAGCLLVTLVPMLFGWRPYVIQSGSMEPKIKVGDVVLASPEQDPEVLLGHVTVFEDPSRPGRAKAHRVISVNPDGTLVTKGDANPTPDSDRVPVETVHGIGRLLVRWVGLPLIWVSTGAWLQLLLFLLGLLVAGMAVASDHEPDEDLEPEGPDDDKPAAGPGSIPEPTPLNGGGGSRSQIAAATSPPLLRLARRSWSSPVVRSLVVRFCLLSTMCLMLLAPATVAAFAATTKNTANTWTVPNWVYTTQANAFGPYLYWKLDETGTATTAADTSGNGRTGRYNTNGSATYFTRLTDGALVSESPDNAVQLNNAASCINTTSTTLVNAPAAVTVIIWFKAPTTYTTGGKLAGFEKPQSGVAAPSTGTYDRHLYMDGNGRVWFGVYNGAYVTLQSTAALNDGNWHMAVGTVGAAGTRLYIDGVLNASNATNTAAEATTGVWRAGCGNLGGWGGSWGGGNSPGTDSATTANRPFRASLDELTVYTSQLSTTDIAFLYWIR